MASFHISVNEDTGAFERRPCHAQTPESCPLKHVSGNPHFADTATADAEVERLNAVMYGNPVGGKKKGPSKVQQENASKDGEAPEALEPDDTDPWAREITPEGMVKFHVWGASEAKADRAIERANKKLEAAGIPERFEAEKEEHFREKKLHTGVMLRERWVTYTLNRPAISYGGYEFQAVMTKEEGGFLTRAASGVDLEGVRPEAMYCEHCGHKRRRAKTYIIKDTQGERHQIGSTCVEAYLGIKPEGLWALTFEPDNMKADEDDFKRSGSSAAHYETDEMLAYALAVSDGGKNFVSRGASGYDRVSTTDHVHEAMFGMDVKGRAWRERMRHEADRLLADGSVERLKSLVREADAQGSDYMTNLQVLVNSDHSNLKSSALLVSAVSQIERQKRLERQRKERRRAEEERRASFASGYLAPVGTALPKDQQLEVKSFRTFWASGYMGGRDVKKTVVTFKSEEGHMVTWFAARDLEHELEEGQKLTIRGGKVKDHGRFDGIDQTVVTRMKFAELQ